MLLETETEVKTLKLLQEEAFEKAADKETKKPLKYAFLLAASVLLFIVAGIFIKMIITTPEDIYASTFEPYKISVKRGGEKKSEIITDYKEGKYSECVKLFESAEVRSVQETFVAGNVYLILAQSEKATKAFEDVISKNEGLNEADKIFYEDAEYYLALSYLKNNEPEKAEELFKKIYKNEHHLYNDKVSRKLLLEIEMSEIGE